MKLTARPIGSEDIEPSEEERRQLSEGEEDLANVEADPSDLMGSREKPPPTLIFGQSWATQGLVESYEQKGYFGPGVCRAPGEEVTPDPRDGECVVFRDFFAAGLRFPLDPIFPKILARFGLRMHHLTPNAIVQLSKFFWAVKTFGGPVSMDAFCRLYEMHPQTRKVSFEEDPQVFSAQSGCCSFHPRRTNRTQGIERIELSFCQKNKWEDDWEQYWFYAKIGFPGADPSERVSYPLAAKVAEFRHITKADFRRTAAGYKECCSAFASAARIMSGRDIIEEYLAAKVWPLTRDWLPGTFSKIRVAGLSDQLPFPDFPLRKPEGVSDDMIVEEAEQEAVVIAGPYLAKERDSFEAVCSERIRVNRSFLKMGVVYGPREAPRERKRGAGTSSPSTRPSEGPIAKKAKKGEPVAAHSSKAPKVASERPSRVSTNRPAAGTARESRGKGIFPCGYSFHIEKENLGSEAFMRELRATESNVPWRSRTGERVHLYLDQFGSFRAEPDIVGAVLTAVQKVVKPSLRVVNLLDEDSDDDAPSVLVDVPPHRRVEHPSQRLLEKASSPEKGGEGEGGEEVPTGVADGADGRSDFVVAPSDPVGLRTGKGGEVQRTTGGDDHVVEVRDRFSDLGTFSISKRLAFQRPDSDSYLRYPLEVDVASVMKELGDLLGIEPSEAETAGVASVSQPALPEDVENFDAEGTSL